MLGLIIRNVDQAVVPAWLIVTLRIVTIRAERQIFNFLLIPIANHVLGLGHVKAVDNLHDPNVEVM